MEEKDKRRKMKGRRKKGKKLRRRKVRGKKDKGEKMKGKKDEERIKIIINIPEKSQCLESLHESPLQCS